MASDLGLIRSTLSEIAEWLDDDSVSEIMLNPSGFHFLERSGELLPLDVVIPYRRLCTTIEIIAHELGKECNESSPLLDGRLADGSRIAAMLPPCSPDGPLLTIRKFPSKRLTVEDLIESGSLPVEVAALIEETLERGENIPISGEHHRVRRQPSMPAPLCFRKTAASLSLRTRRKFKSPLRTACASKQSPKQKLPEQ